MRLGDLDALKKAIIEPLNVNDVCKNDWYEGYYTAKNEDVMAIDNAPTVEPERPQGDLISRRALKPIFEAHEDRRGDLDCDWRILIDIVPTYNEVGDKMATAEGFCTNKLNCDNCEGKAFSYFMGLKDGYLLGGFQLTELRRWLTSQGYSEGTVDDKINEFTRFVEKIRGEEE